MSKPASGFEPIDIYNYLKQVGTTATGHNNLSLLKEFIDNSLDANAKNITITEEKGINLMGKKYYRVIIKDDGYGMNKTNLYRAVQLHSKNVNGGIGKFGIGGVSALINWSDIEDTKYEKYITITTLYSDGIVRQIKINWNDIKTLQDYINQVEESYCENDTNAIKQLKEENIKQGTIITIQTSERKFLELMELENDMNDYINLGTTYNNYIEEGTKITLFNDIIINYAFPKSLLSGIFNIEIWYKKTMFAFSTKIGKKEYTYVYENKIKAERNIRHDELYNENWIFMCDVILKLDIANDIEMPDIKKKSKDLNLNKWKSFNEFCKLNGIEDKTDINNLAHEYIKKIYVGREDNNKNIRFLGGLDLLADNIIDYDYRLNNFITIIKKQLIFNYKFDDKIGLTQQNKSVIEWTNSPIGMNKFIIKIITNWVKSKIEPKLKEISDKEQEKQKKYQVIEKYLNKKQKYIIRMKYNKYIPTYLNKPTLISCENVIIKIFLKLKHKKNTAILQIQLWFRAQKTLKCSVTGFIKFQRFIKWSYKYYYINKLQKWIRNILIKKAIINYVLSFITKKILLRKSANIIQNQFKRYIIFKNLIEKKNNITIKIQKNIRMYLAIKYVEKEKSRDKYFKSLARNFKKHIRCPLSRHEYNVFKTEVLNKLVEMEKML